MKNKTTISLLAIISLFLLTSCWDSRELDELAVFVGMGIDKKEDDTFRVSLQIINSLEVGVGQTPGSSTPVTIRTEESSTLYEAARKASISIPKKPNIAHLRAFVIGEELAREGITDVLDFITRHPDFRSDFYIIVAKNNKAEDVLKILTPLEQIPANQLFNSLETSQKVWAESVNVEANELIKNATEHGRSIVLPGIEVKGDVKKGESKKNTETTDSPTKLEYSGIAIFSKQKLIDWLDEEEGKGHSFITDRIKNTVESTKCPDGGDIAMEIHTSKTKLKAQKTAENKPKITIDIKSHGDIGEVNCSMDLTNPQTIKEVEKLFEKEITKIVKKVLTKTQEENKVDSFGIGQVIRASYPKIWEEMKDDWGEHFAALDIEVKVDVTVRETGEIIDPVKKQFKE